MAKRVVLDSVQQAVAKAQQATNLFARAHTELEEANVLLDEAIRTDLAVVESLQERVRFATEQAKKNSAVQARLAEFVA